MMMFVMPIDNIAVAALVISPYVCSPATFQSLTNNFAHLV